MNETAVTSVMQALYYHNFKTGYKAQARDCWDWVTTGTWIFSAILGGGERRVLDPLETRDDVNQTTRPRLQGNNYNGSGV